VKYFFPKVFSKSENGHFKNVHFWILEKSLEEKFSFFAYGKLPSKIAK